MEETKRRKSGSEKLKSQLLWVHIQAELATILSRPFLYSISLWWAILQCIAGASRIIVHHHPPVHLLMMIHTKRNGGEGRRTEGRRISICLDDTDSIHWIEFRTRVDPTHFIYSDTNFFLINLRLSLWLMAMVVLLVECLFSSVGG